MKTIKILLLIWFCSFALAEPTKNIEEYRAMWVTRYELTSPANIKQIVHKAKANNFNALFVQVCGRGTAFYNSTLIPKDSTVTTWDPLALLVTTAKKENIEIHAWVNMLYTWSANEQPPASNHVLNQHPDWFLNYNIKILQDRGFFLNPAKPEVHQYLRALCQELINNYSISGIHLDYIRYPGLKYAYNDDFTSKSFEKIYGVDPRALFKNKEVSLKLYGQEEYKNYLTKWNDYLRQNVTDIVREIAKDIAAKKPEVLLSAAVIAEYDQAYNDYFQDWSTWMEKSYLDIVIPMAYSKNEGLVKKQIIFATQLAEKYDAPLLIGLGAWQQRPEAIIKQIDYTRNIRGKMGFKQLAGVVLFSYDKIAKEQHYLEKIKEKLFIGEVLRPGFGFNKNRLVEKENQQPVKIEPNPDQIDLKYHSNIIG